MLREYSKDDEEEDGVLLGEQEIQAAKLSVDSQSYSERLLYSIKTSFISSFGIVGGSFMVAAVSPKVLSFVLTRAVPSIATADLGIKTVAASVAIGTYALSSKAAYVVAVPRSVPVTSRKGVDQRLRKL